MMALVQEYFITFHLLLQKCIGNHFGSQNTRCLQSTIKESCKENVREPTHSGNSHSQIASYHSLDWLFLPYLWGNYHKCNFYENICTMWRLCLQRSQSLSGYRIIHLEASVNWMRFIFWFWPSDWKIISRRIHGLLQSLVFNCQ